MAVYMLIVIAPKAGFISQCIGEIKVTCVFESVPVSIGTNLIEIIGKAFLGENTIVYLFDGRVYAHFRRLRLGKVQIWGIVFKYGSE